MYINKNDRYGQEIKKGSRIQNELVTKLQKNFKASKK